MSETARPGAPPVSVRLIGADRGLVTSGGVTRLAYARATGEGVWVFLDGDVFLVNTRPGDAPPRVTHDDFAALAAPMPATVIAVNVAPGEEVTAGTTMILLEAMKMELPIVAPRNGVVARVSCRVGELVQPGVILVELT